MMSFKKESSACTSGQCRGHLPTGEVVVSEVVDQKDTSTPLDLRDIGAHRCTGTTWINTTATTRFADATADAKRAKQLPLPYPAKA